MLLRERIRDNRSRPRTIEADCANCPNFKVNFTTIRRYLSRKNAFQRHLVFDFQNSQREELLSSLRVDVYFFVNA